MARGGTGLSHFFIPFPPILARHALIAGLRPGVAHAAAEPRPATARRDGRREGGLSQAAPERDPKTALSILAPAFLRHDPAGPQQVGTAAPGGCVRDHGPEGGDAAERLAGAQRRGWARPAAPGGRPGGRVESDPERSGGARFVRCEGDEKEPVGHPPRLVGSACVRGSGRCHRLQGTRHTSPASLSWLKSPVPCEEGCGVKPASFPPRGPRSGRTRRCWRSPWWRRGRRHGRR